MEHFYIGDDMPDPLPVLDTSSTEWLMQAHQASLGSRFCTMPDRYFQVLNAWGYVEGTATAAKLTGKGLSQALQVKAAAKPSRKRKH